MQIGCGGLCGNIRKQVNAAFGSRQFDPRELLCASAAVDAATVSAERQLNEEQQCLTEAEVDVIRKFYMGPVDSVTGSHLNGKLSSVRSLPALRYLIVEPNPPETYSLNDLEFAEATVDLLRA
ncbi:Tannase and feruloyl esterase [Phytophthora boehmeriae]|uniref:Tannase and feruloyl esterase n=1 Tax=Phytophthora boehmeriae TaxID=109152 RepID=A0A8T1WJ13_9STRA|nr:Tannase and feruloyl esterase [Phytophthora boehmeriae]